MAERVEITVLADNSIDIFLPSEGSRDRGGESAHILTEVLDKGIIE
jgi:hypothetical protein